MASSNIPPNVYMNLPGYLQEPWNSVLREEMEKQYFKDLMLNLATASMAGKVIYPPVDLTFNAFNKTPLYKVVVGLHGLYREQMVKVVILGQDPYPYPKPGKEKVGILGQDPNLKPKATGLAFSIPYGFPLTLSLRNIFNELHRDPKIEFMVPNHGNLTSWAEQGVLLLNTTLTVEAGRPNSHSGFGWQTFTDYVIKLISDRCSGVVFMLWGEFAHQKECLINQQTCLIHQSTCMMNQPTCQIHKPNHVIIPTCHPANRNVSPQSPFFGSNCFSRCNYALAQFGHEPINWSLP